MNEFIAETIDIFSMDFMIRAVIVGLFVSVCAALLGVSLVLKRYAMIGTGLSHIGFAAMIIAGVIDFAPIAFSMVVVVAAAFLLLRLNENSKIKGDSAVALISTGGLATGVIVMGLTTGITLQICDILFGNIGILTITQTDMYVSVGLSAVVIILFVLFYKQLFAVTFDETFAKATGTNVELYKSLLAILTAVTVVLGMRMMGALLITSLTLFPALSAMRICKRFLSVVIASAIIGVVCFGIGIIFSVAFNLPPGASIVGVNLILFTILSSATWIKRKVLA
ncbi:MAG: metal ABC transporter permease [Defluviitaleaceae bacterium]|nr:metal ABC transporter permease [Defluviitaleaceae bacterium]